MKIKPNIYLTADTHFDHGNLWSIWKERKQGFEKEIVEALWLAKVITFK